MKLNIGKVSGPSILDNIAIPKISPISLSLKLFILKYKPDKGNTTANEPK
ncbi:hypothetical protein PPOP_3322 [Paenibacillus popilliae ATCC 14706]|uniref:Uncharacterized protein n=1 Tax=Paenibacillus popilliae ATCC 14706 TaxID=1212764 RepID=M9LCM8_PAEPP|nr:hypothetical protein PPOP_3322 [Paenibacillus popilliae ATCC 14706]